MPGTDYIPEQGVWFQMKYLSGEMKILSSLLLIAIIKDKPNVKLGSMHVDVLCHECSVVITISLCEWPQPSSNFNHPPVKLCDCICKVEWVSPWNNLEKKKQTKKTEIQLCGGYSVFKTTIFHSDTHTHTHTPLSLSPGENNTTSAVAAGKHRAGSSNTAAAATPQQQSCVDPTHVRAEVVQQHSCQAEVEVGSAHCV